MREGESNGGVTVNKKLSPRGSRFAIETRDHVGLGIC